MTSSIHISTAVRQQRTILQNLYCTTPFKVADITEDRSAGRLQLMLMSSSPGVLDGDQCDIKIELASGASLQLHTQSYQRLFNMKRSAAQSLEVHLATDSSFCFLPQPSVPHAASVFRSVNKFFLSGNCSLVFGEILTCGRKLNGEVFQFSKYHSSTSIFIDNKIVARENLLMEPAAIDPGAIGQLEGFTHQASLVYLHPVADIKALATAVDEFLTGQNKIIFGVTRAPVNGLVVRILGYGAEQLYDCLKTIAAILPQLINAKPVTHAI